GVKNVTHMVSEVRDRWRLGKIKNAEDAEGVVKQEMLSGWGPPEERELKFAPSGPTVILVAGINGAGKTTSIAKLAWLLKNELTKIRDVMSKRIEGAPHEVLLVLDATTGQNAILQAENFGKAINVTGIILAKLDGTAKGGVVLAIRDQLQIPVKFVGLGE